MAYVVEFADVVEVLEFPVALLPTIEVEEIDTEWLDDSDYDVGYVIDSMDSYAR